MQNNSSFVPNRSKTNATSKVLRRPRSGGKTKAINRLDNRLHELDNVLKKSNLRGRGRSNPYVCTLIDPENCHGVRFPDDLPKATAAVRALINHNAYYFPDSTIEPAGTYLNVLSPVVVHPMLEYRSDPVTTLFSAVTQEEQVLFGGCTRPDDCNGLFPLLEDTSTPSTSSDQMWIPQLATLNMRCQWRWEDQDFAFPPFRGVNTDGVFYGCPMGLNVVAGTPGLITVYVRTIQPLTAAVNPFTVYATSVNGSVAFTSGAAAIGDTTLSYTLSATLLAGLANAGGYFGLPGLGFRIANTTSRSYLVGGYSVGVITDQIGVGSVTRVQPRFVGVSVPDEITYCQKVDQYRVVSMSNWLEYDGSDLQNGGQAASILYRGGQSAGEVGLYNYQSIAEAPESYAGPLKTGTYTIWAPNSEADMLMRPLNSMGHWQYPFICNAGVVATPSQINAIRLRVAINFEFVSTAQFFDMEKPEPHPEWIRQASLLLREHPCTMANGRHLAWIKGIAKDALDLAQGIGRWGKQNSDWLIPAGSALASLLV